LQLNDITSSDELQLYLVENPIVRDVLSTSGWVRNLTMENKCHASQTILVHEVLIKRKVAMDQLRDGLKCLNISSLLQQHPDVMRVYFVKAEEEPLNPGLLVDKVFQNAHQIEADEENEKSRKFFLQSLTTFHSG